MTGSYAYTPHIWPSLLTVVLLVALAIFSWRRRTVPAARVFAVTCLIGVPCAAGYVVESAAVDAETKLLGLWFGAVWQVPLATAATCFALEYAWPGRWLTRRNLVLLSIAPILALGLILTNGLHNLMLGGYSGGEALVPERGSAAWVLTAYGYALAILNLVVFAWLFVRSPRQRWPAALMVAGQIIGHVLYALRAAGLLTSGLLLDTPPFAVDFVLYAIALFGFRIFDPITAARRAVVAQMREGVVVLDAEGRVAGLNPAAERILRLPAKRAAGRPARELLPACTGELLAGTGGTQLEISLPERRQDGGGVGQEVRHYVLQISPLSDWRELEVGRLLLLLDVTERRRAQAQILEQQRALAMLRERESLARELHDSLGQVLGYASLKMGATRALIAGDQLAKADDQLAHLEEIMADAHADVREYILNLRTAPTEERPFFSALQHYLAGFRQNYGFQVDLSIGPGVDDDLIPAEAQMQLFRIVQEVFSNVRKHADTSCVRLSFERQDALLRMCIQDDGQGFDPQQAAGAEGSHFGLRFMRERAEQLGGTLRVDSAPGQGTCVTVEVPVKRDGETR